MKRILNRSFIVFIAAFAFFAGLTVFCVRLGTGAQDWANKPFNGHAAGNGGLAYAGTIYDRDGVILAQTVNGQRIYNEDQATRCALLHMVGDNSLNISTAIQSMYRTKLTGYSLIWGLGLPESLRSGSDITITVDSAACAAAYNAIGDRTGACVIYNYKTGEILCSVSTKGYDPQNPPEITEENETEYDGVYLDNVLSSSFPPGSTFKIVTAAAMIENLPEAYTMTVDCDGSEEIGGSEITCTHAHGEVDIYSAFSGSCNVFFATAANLIGSEKMQETADRLGFNKEFNAGGVTLEKSVYDVGAADENQLAWSGVGQYTDLANPMHMAMLCGAIANGGTSAEPYYISKSGLFSSDSGGSGEEMVSAQTASSLRELMRGAAESYGDYIFAGLTGYAKTGTAEVGDGEPDAWFVGFTSDEEYPLAFAAVIEHGGSGLEAASGVITAALSEIVQ